MKLVVDANELGTATAIRFEVTPAENTKLRQMGLDQPYRDSVFNSLYGTTLGYGLGISINPVRDPEAAKLRDQALQLQRAAKMLEGVLPRPVELPKLFGVPVKVVG